MNEKPVTEMTDVELDEALESLAGWYREWRGNVLYLEDREGAHVKLDDWHPTRSLDKCHEIEGDLMRFACDIYAGILASAVGCDFSVSYLIIHATARQKAEALYLTLKEAKE